MFGVTTKIRRRRYRKASQSGRNKTVIHKNPKDLHASKNSGAKYQTEELAKSGSAATMDGTNHVVHPTAVRAKIPLKRKVNEVRRAATKARKAVQSTLGRPAKKNLDKQRSKVQISTKMGAHAGGIGKMNAEGVKKAKRAGGKTQNDKSKNPTLSPTVDTVATLKNGITTVHAAKIVAIPSTSAIREKPTSSGKFSITTLKRLKPKSFNIDKSKNIRADRHKLNNAQMKSRSEAKKMGKITNLDKFKAEKELKSIPRKAVITNPKHRSPSKRATIEVDMRKYGRKPASSATPSKKSKTLFRLFSPKQVQKPTPVENQTESTDRSWILNRFLSCEDQPLATPSSSNSLQGSITSMNTLTNASPNFSHLRSGSTRPLLHQSRNSDVSPVRGVINEGFINSPRESRTHSSLRAGKCVSPIDVGDKLKPISCKRSISMEPYKKTQFRCSADL